MSQPSPPIRVPRSALFCAALAMLLLESASASAQSVHMPMVGRQFPSVGVAAQGGAVIDLPESGVRVSPAAGGVARLGLHHIVGPRLSMSAEVGLGATYLGEHPMATVAPADAEVGFAWQLAVLARYFPIYARSGLTFGGGLQYSGLRLSDVPSTQMGAELRAGYYRWHSEERFWTLEFGLSIPLIEGLTLPTEFANPDEPSSPTVERTWHYVRASLGLSFAF